MTEGVRDFSNIPVNLIEDPNQIGNRVAACHCLLGDLPEGSYSSGSTWGGAYVENSRGVLQLDELGPLLADVSKRIPHARHYVWANSVKN